MNINFQCETRDYETFRNAVGHGNVSSTLRNFVLSYGEKSDIDERKLRKQFEMIEPEYKKAKATYERIKAKIEDIEHQKHQEELKRIEKEKKFREKMSIVEFYTKKKDLARELP